MSEISAGKLKANGASTYSLEYGVRQCCTLGYTTVATEKIQI